MEVRQGQLWLLAGLSDCYIYEEPIKEIIENGCSSNEKTIKYMKKIFEKDHNFEQNKFDIAHSLQLATESVVKDIICKAMKLFPSENLCIAGGCTLNSVMIGKIKDWFPNIKNIYIREEVKNWFTRDEGSPYMSMVLKWKKQKTSQIPAVNHFDNSARLQTVTEKNNSWYYRFLKKWEKKTNVPILLNTSFNDSELIVETPERAINCFLKIEIDYLYLQKQTHWFVKINYQENFLIFLIYLGA